MKLSPMMEQYLEIKEQYKDCILFFRLGDFYEMFFEDAKIASKELELTLTGRSCGQEERAPMCGVPFHAAEAYIAKLVDKGYKIAICEQVEDPKVAKGIVKREVVRIVTPGTLISQTMLQEKENNYLAAVYVSKEAMAVAYCDISTGELSLTEYSGPEIYSTILNELVKVNPKEIIVSSDFADRYSLEEIKLVTDAYLSVQSDSYFSEKGARQAISAQFNSVSLTSLGLDFRPTGTMALGALLSYLLETQKQSLKHIAHVNIYEIGNQMTLDKATIRNLEITETLYEKKIQGSLLGILDKTHTAMGSRKMRQWLRQPLNNSKEINLRLDGVEELYQKLLVRNNIQNSLKAIYDFERLIGRIACGNANGRDLIALRDSIGVIPEIKADLGDCQSEILKEIEEEISDLKDVYEIIHRAIMEEPSFLIKDGGLIKEGYSKELDELKFSIKDGKEWISTLEAKERERTGIKTLKVGFNRVFGYYLEVSKSMTDSVPEEYIRKQTLTNGERYITPELKEMENLVLNAEVKINQLEYHLFLDVRNYIQGFIEDIQKTSRAIARLDVLISFATVSEKLGYSRPLINDSREIEIVKGRHPVIEQTVSDGLFVSNDTYINDSDGSMLLITGPNMAGKSTYMRQTALIVLMAQAGCFVPCEKAKIGVVDRIFTRIGASDNLAQGQSTFFVEMSELSYILNTATENSLIILDEIGRGTSTYDGLSIAWAVVEHLTKKGKQIRTLFATHYHELTDLEKMIYGVKNLTVDVAEENGTIIFLHKIVEGSASKSYGIHVAKLAGIPKTLLERAEEKLRALEKEDHVSIKERGLSENFEVKQDVEENSQLSMFDFAPNPVIERLKELNLMELTPSQAFKIIEELKEYIDD